ncbi:hypothetical protein GGU11DRAFT_745356 [Lentinula aff. detonsa]|nr:hypothetical protein GGU11DRAFT_745356 [Lentinula aff. detonsa]
MNEPYSRAPSPFWMPPNSRTKFVRAGAAPTITIEPYSRARSPFWLPLNSRTKFVRPGAAPTITSLFHPQTSSLWTCLLRFTHQAPSTYNSRSKRVCSARSPFRMPPNSRTKFIRPGAAPTITKKVRVSSPILGLVHLSGCPSTVERNSFGLALPQRSRVFSTRKRVHYGLVCPSTVERKSFGLALPQRSRVFSTRKRVHYGLVCCASPTSTIHIQFPQQTSLFRSFTFWMPLNSRTKFVRPGAAPTITIRVWRVASRDSSRKWVLAGAWLHADGKPTHCRLSNSRNKQAAKAWVLQELGPA